jgi:hypothetical protein
MRLFSRLFVVAFSLNSLTCVFAQSSINYQIETPYTAILKNDTSKIAIDLFLKFGAYGNQASTLVTTSNGKFSFGLGNIGNYKSKSIWTQSPANSTLYVVSNYNWQKNLWKFTIGLNAGLQNNIHHQLQMHYFYSNIGFSLKRKGSELSLGFMNLISSRMNESINPLYLNYLFIASKISILVLKKRLSFGNVLITPTFQLVANRVIYQTFLGINLNFKKFLFDAFVLQGEGIGFFSGYRFNKAMISLGIEPRPTMHGTRVRFYTFRLNYCLN